MTLESLRALQKRVRDCTEADRLLDAYIHQTLIGSLLDTETPPHKIERFTTDPDGLGACVALLREVLPGAMLERDQCGRYYIDASPRSPNPEVCAQPLANDCLTFIDAICAAKIAELEAEENAI